MEQEEGEEQEGVEHRRGGAGRGEEQEGVEHEEEGEELQETVICENSSGSS